MSISAGDAAHLRGNGSCASRDDLHLLTTRPGQYVVLKGKRDLLEKLAADEALSGNKKMQQGIAEIRELFDQLEDFQVMHSISFDLSLARGLDYCMQSPFSVLVRGEPICDDEFNTRVDTGAIFEVVTEGSAPEVVASSAEGAPKTKSSKKKGGKEGGDDDDRSDDPTLGIGTLIASPRYRL